MGLYKMMNFTAMFIVTIILVLYFSPSAYSGTYVDLTAILSAPAAPFHTFLSLLQTDNVIQTLQEQANSQEGLTLFAPNDVAFARDNVPLASLSLAQTQSLLLFHAVPQYFSNTPSDSHTLSQNSPVTTMAGVQYTLNITYVPSPNDMHVYSGWNGAQVLAAVDVNPTEIYQIDTVLMPEAIFGTNIPPPRPPLPSTPATTPTFGTNIAPPSPSTPASTPSGSITASVRNNVNSIWIFTCFIFGGLL